MYSDCRFHPPCICALLTNKRKNLYRKLLVGLSELTGGVAAHINLLDFEKAAINMFVEQYSASEIKCHYSHLCQNFSRKMSEIGLKKVSEGNTELAPTLPLTAALSFAPDYMVSVCFDLVNEEIKEVSEVLKLEKESL